MGRDRSVPSERMQFTISPDGENLNIRTPKLEKERIDNLVDEYGFQSRASFCRHMIYLGINTLVENDPSNKDYSESTNNEAVTIREITPKGEENAVEIDDFWEEIMKNKFLDIVENDPEIKREGFSVYR